MLGQGVLALLELSLAESQAKVVFVFDESGRTESHCQDSLVGETCCYSLASS